MFFDGKILFRYLVKAATGHEVFDVVTRIIAIIWRNKFPDKTFQSIQNYLSSMTDPHSASDSSTLVAAAAVCDGDTFRKFYFALVTMNELLQNVVTYVRTCIVIL